MSPCRFVWSLCLGLAVWGLIAQSARADPSTDIEILGLINSQQFDEARALSQANDPTPADDAFLEGRILKVQGRLDDAIAAFRLCLALDPTNLAARRELAHTLLLARQYDTSEFHFDALLDADPDTRMHDDYRRFLRVIGQNKPWGVTGHFALLPSTNVNRGTTNTVFDTTSGTFVINPDSRAESGTGLQLGISGYARHISSGQSRWTLAGSLVGTGYENEIHNSATAALGLTFERSYENGQWSVAPYVSKTWRETDADQNVAGLRFGISRRLNARTSLLVFATHDYRQYPNQPYKDGPTNEIALTLAHQFDPSLALRGTLTAEQSRPDALHLQYDGYSLAAELSKTWNGGLATAVALQGGQRGFIGDFPLTTTPRDDEFVTLSFGVQNSRFNLQGFTPRLSCSHTLNRSNVAFYDYDATECQVTLSTEF